MKNQQKAQEFLVNTTNDQYVSSSEMYTATLIAFLYERNLLNEYGTLDKQRLFNLSKLSDGTVRTHLKGLGRRGHLVIDRDSIAVKVA